MSSDRANGFGVLFKCNRFGAHILLTQRTAETDHDYDQLESKKADLTTEQKKHDGVTHLILGSSD